MHHIRTDRTSAKLATAASNLCDTHSSVMRDAGTVKEIEGTVSCFISVPQYVIVVWVGL
jgi:hypothetical protein